MTRARFRFLLVVAGLVLGFYMPTSVGGVIARPLTAVSLLSTCAVFTMLLASQRSTVPLALVGASFAIPILLFAFTITSPFMKISPGVVAIYLWLALLFLLDLRSAVGRRGLERVFLAVTAISLLFGYALAMDVRVADDVARSAYAGFDPDLLYSMVVLSNKPVLTFATHSMAGFMIYLLGYMALSAYRTEGGWWRLALVAGYLGLLVELRSTTGMMFAAITVPQTLLAVRRRHPRLTVPMSLVVVLGVLALPLALGLSAQAIGAAVREAVVGDRWRGLFARYSQEGLLAPNFAYFSRSPFSPIGFTATDTLFLGDSGLVVNLLRGSIPLMVTVYGGLFLFLRLNLRRRATAAWLWCVTVLFEVGFTPLQYFRFAAFVPFLVVYLNAIESSPGEGRPETSGAGDAGAPGFDFTEDRDSILASESSRQAPEGSPVSPDTRVPSPPHASHS